MTPSLNAAYATLADAFRYPAPGRLEALKRGQAALPEAAGQTGYAAFLRAIERTSLGAWEELHTKTLDLNPPAAPYIGYQMWGDSYQRGAFMAKLNRALRDADVDKEGELPDHLVPVLRYLAAADEPLPELVEVLGPALARMISALREADPDNPYLNLLEAVQSHCPSPEKEEA